MKPILADTSAWVRSGRPGVDARFEEWLVGDLMRVCSPVRLELGFSAQSAADAEALQHQLRSIRDVPVTERTCRRAEGVQGALAATGRHRGPRPIDLLIAAAAEVHDLVLIHYDHHFDVIAEITRQPMEWLAPRGTLD